jgi:hypothetical protein
MAEQDLPPGVEYTNYLSRVLPTPTPTPIATPTPTPVATPTPIPQAPGAMADWLAKYKQEQLAAAALRTSPHEQLGKVIAILHPEPQQEHPLAATDRIVSRADSLEHQLGQIQQRTSDAR